MFGRRGKKNEKKDVADTAEVAADPPQEPEKEVDQHRAQGPWDAAEEMSDAPRLDLGSLQVPVETGTEVQVNVAQQENRIIGVTLVSGDSAVQVQPFASPKSSGLWDEMRAELHTQITEQGGQVEEHDGTFGTELRAIVPIEGETNEDGHQMGQRMRFVGVDGPRWVLRGVIRGEAAGQPEAMAHIEEIFAKIVVVRGEQPIPPRDLLDIQVPAEIRESMERQVAEQAQQATAGSD